MVPNNCQSLPQSRILYPSLFNIFLKQTKMNALEVFIGTIAVGGRNHSLRFTDHFDLITGSRENLTDLMNRLTYQHIGMARK